MTKLSRDWYQLSRDRTYGGYMPQDQNVRSTSVQMIVLVLIVSLLAAPIATMSGKQTRIQMAS